ncbi:MAG TPA: peptidylprolyl isomerase [Chloroflexota bacterium]|nr:peptidylprolyl isomerase [Chloroflexota bacterium]
MNADTNKVTQRRRRAPARHVPAIVEERPREPFFFKWGADLNHREREALKERIALFAGIGLAIVVAAILGFGALYQYVIHPGQIAAQNAKPVAKIGNYTITLGEFKAVEKFENKQLSTQITQVQQQLASLQAAPKKNALQIQQYQTQLAQLQQQQSTLASGTLQSMINNQIVLQRSASAGVPITPKMRRAAQIQAEEQLGGVQTLQTFIKSSGLTPAEFNRINVANYAGTKLQQKLAAAVPHVQTEVRASHILISAKKKSLAVQLYHRARNGANFAALAKKYSIDTTSAKKGGDLGFFTHGQMVPAFDKAAFSMKVGQIRLIKSRFGWHIIEVTGRKKVRLAKVQYQQQQNQAMTTWLSEQQSKLGLQHFIAVSKLPGSKSSSTSTLPTQLQQPAQLPQTQKPSSSTKNGKSSNSSTTKSSSSKSSTSTSSSNGSSKHTGSKHK